MSTRRADLLPAGKFPLGVNVRRDGDGKIRTRPGYDQIFNDGGGGAITDIGSYASLNTDSQPRILAHTQAGHVYLDSGANAVPGQNNAGQSVGTVGTGGPGASLIPFRPSESPQPWMYVANPTGYEKFSAPDADNNVIQQKTGIAEPQPMPQALQDGLFFHDFTGATSNWTASGTASALCHAIRLQDTVGVVFADPVQPPAPSPTQPFNQRYYISVTGLNQYPGDACSGQNQGKPISYQIGERLDFGPLGTTANLTVVEDVFPAIGTGDAIEVEAIYYLEGQMTADRHRCVIVPSQVGLLNNSIATGPGQPSSALQPPRAATVQGLRRGSMIQLNGGEILLIENVITGPNGQLSIETATTGTHQVGELITGVLSLAIANIIPVPGQLLFSHQINFQANPGQGGHGNPGLAVVTYKPVTNPPWPGNPFNMDLGGMGVPQENDLLHISITAVADPGSIVQDLIQFRVAIDIDDGTFERNTLYYPVSTSLLGAAANTGTPGQQTSPQPTSQFTTSQILATNKTMYDAIYEALRQHGYDAASVLNPRNAISINPSTGEVQIFGPNGRMISLNVPLAAGVGIYTELIVSLSSLQRTGLNHALTLANAVAVQIAVITSGTYTIGFGGIWVGGGGQPDTGSTGSPYYYRAIGRSSITGARSNPSPAMRYGVTPRCQPVWVQLPKLPQEPLADGTSIDDAQVDTWDIYRYGGTITSWRFIGSAHANDQWYRDNIFDAAAFGGSEMETDNYEPWPTVDIPWHPSLVTNVIGTIVNIFGDASAFPASIHRWLAGTLITLNLNTAYTLWNRPVPIAGGWQLQLLEAAGAMTNPDLFVGEPVVADQNLPYLIGPDAKGVMFACGDPFRPGSFQGSKPNNPDATPNDVYDLVAPSEPLLGGEILDGIPVIASSRRWWMLQPALGGSAQWNPTETVAGRGLAAPWGHCTDGKAIYFWAKDGIYAMVPGGPAQPLTTGDIGNLFPQGETGITQGTDVVYAGYTIHAPDYTYVASFRLSVMDSMLRAHYVDRTATRRTLVLDMTPGSDGQPAMAWSLDEYADPISASFQPAQPPATLLSLSPRKLYEESYFADTNGGVWQETDLHNDGPSPIPAWLATPEFDGGDERVRKEWLDSMIDIWSPSGGTLTPVSNAHLMEGGGPIPTENDRTQHLIPLTIEAGEPGHDEPEPQPPDLGLLFQWEDDFRVIPPAYDGLIHPTTLYKWTQEWIAQPVEIKTWESDWTSFGDCGLGCYVFIYRLRIPYEAEAPVTLRMETNDGVSPKPIILPATGGEYQKVEFVPTANKGLLYQFTATSDGNFAFIDNAMEVIVCAWSRTGPCVKCNLGGTANP